MFYLLLTVYLQGCGTCEVTHETTIMLATNNEFVCEIAAKRLVDLNTVEEYGIRQWASADCKKVKVV